MRSLSAPVLSALQSGAVAIAQLVELSFSTPIRLNSSTWTLSWGGVDYVGAYGLGTVGVIEDSPGEIKGLQLELAAADSARIAVALDDADVVQGTACTIRTAIIETTTYTVLDAPIEWTGYLDTMAIAEDGQTAVVRVTAESRAVDFLRGNAWMYTDADQIVAAPTDRSFKYVVDQVDKPVVWPAKSFYYK